MTEGLFLVTLIFLVYVVCLWLVPGILKAFNNSHSIPSELVVSRYINSNVLEENGSDALDNLISENPTQKNDDEDVAIDTQRTRNEPLDKQFNDNTSQENNGDSNPDLDIDPLGIRN